MGVHRVREWLVRLQPVVRTGPPDGGSSPRLPFRLVLVAAQAATILLTWRVWTCRDAPPMLPLLDLPRFEAGWPLLASLAVVLLCPLAGVAVHSALLAVAIVADQSRMQPHVISIGWLLWSTTGLPGGLVVSRAALVATWLYAGIHKISSASYYTRGAPWLLTGIWPDGPSWLAAPLAAAIAVAEIGLGAGCLWPRARRIVAVAAALFHVATFIFLACGLRWDMPVWPWNLALACAGPAVVAPWRGQGLGLEWRAASRFARGVAVLLIVMPAGYWLGIVDAFLAHCVYSENRPKAYVCTPFSRTDIEHICNRLDVVLPPAHRLYLPFFRGIGRPGEWLEVEDPRWIARLRGFDRRKIVWNDVAVPAPPSPQPRSAP
jgi:hypothetical protein